MASLTGKTIFITGGANGRTLEAKLLAQGLKAHFIEADISKGSEAASVVAESFQVLDSIDVLFNHVDIIIVKPFLDFSIEEWDELMDNNAKSAFLVLPSMLERGRGNLVFTSTTGVKAATPLESIYCASKSAMHQSGRSIAVEYRDRGIRANCICPCFIRTNHGMHEIEQLRNYGIFASENDVSIMQGRICEPEEVASVALFHASDDSSFINGAEIFVDNTFTAV